MWEAIEHFFEHTVWHAFQDVWLSLPVIFFLYVLIELLESKADVKKITRFGGTWGPVVGAATGLVPQCGFSVMAAKFFERKHLTVGTLLAIFFATSDEAFFVLLSDSTGAGARWILPILLIKVVLGVAVGYGVDGFLRLIGKKQNCMELPQMINGRPTTTHEIFMQRYLDEREMSTECSCGRSHSGESPWKQYFFYPLLHALKVWAFVFLVTVVMTAIMHSEAVENKFTSAMNANVLLQPLITCAIGLIPNCASSVVITQAFLSGGITFGACVAGLCVNAGMGFVVLFRNFKKWKRNLILVAFCYALSVAIGVLLNLYPLTV
ncbi:MAG: arsenic efflux protein [Clostridia bacterium]|nr:arsenic efflux protein [Clostridia bacterium]